MNTEERLNEALALLREAQREVWNTYYDLPGRGHAAFVEKVDKFLGQESAWRWRYDARGYDSPEWDLPT